MEETKKKFYKLPYECVWKIKTIKDAELGQKPSFFAPISFPAMLIRFGISWFIFSLFLHYKRRFFLSTIKSSLEVSSTSKEHNSLLLLLYSPKDMTLTLNQIHTKRCYYTIINTFREIKEEKKIWFLS